MNRKNWIWLAVGMIVAMVLLAPLPMFAKGKSGGGSPPGQVPTITVTTYVYNLNTNAATNYYVESDQSTDPGEYDNDSSTGVTSILIDNNAGTASITNGDWRLALGGNTANRYVDIKLVPDGSVTDVGLPTGYFNDQSGIETGCWSLGESMLTMASGTTMDCPMTLRLSTGATKSYYYRFGMGTSAAPGTNMVEITCNGVDSTDGGCNNWTIQPMTSGTQNPGETVALLKRICQSGHCTAADLGDYFLTFKFYITRP